MKAGRKPKPPGWVSPTLTHHCGTWSWNDPLFWTKIERRGVNECWPWLGSQAYAANLFGAYRNLRRQMTQAPRILWMTTRDEPVEGFLVRHTCGNRYCMNPDHLILQAEQRGEYFERDGSGKNLHRQLSNATE